MCVPAGLEVKVPDGALTVAGAPEISLRGRYDGAARAVEIQAAGVRGMESVQADAGFVYITDAKAANGKVLVVRLPAQAKPFAKDFIAVVKSGKNQAAARAFVQKVLSPHGQTTLHAAGFGKT